MISQDPSAGTQLPSGIHTISFESAVQSGNPGNCSFVLTVDEELGFDDNTLDNNFQVYPNPASSVINVFSKNQELSSIVIYDILGERLYSNNTINSEQVTIDITEYSEGMYFLTINNNATKKIIKE